MLHPPSSNRTNYNRVCPMIHLHFEHDPQDWRTGMSLEDFLADIRARVQRGGIDLMFAFRSYDGYVQQ